MRFVLALALVLALGFPSATHAKDGKDAKDSSVKQATDKDKTPPPAAQLPIEKTIGADPTPAAGNLEGGPRALAFSADGKHLAVGNHDGAVSLLDPLSEEKPTWRRLAQHGGAVAGIAFVSRGEQTFVVSAGDDGSVLATSFDASTAVVSSRALGLGSLTALAVLDAGPAKPRLAIGTSKGALALVAIESEPVLQGTIEVPGAPSIASIVALSKDKVAVAAWDGAVHVIDVAKKKVVKSQKISPVELTSIALSHDGKSLAIGGWKKGITLVDPSSLKTNATFEPHRGSTLAVTCAEKTARIATASTGDETITVCEPFEKTWVVTGRAKVTGVPSAIAFTPDALRLAVATFDGTVIIFKLAEVTRG